MEKRIFRKKPLNRLASPEQLDALMVVTRPAGWLFLIALAMIVLFVVFWSIFGSIPEKVVANGILIKPGGVITVRAFVEGQLNEILFDAGDIVQKDQVIARVNPFDLRDRSRLARIQAEEAALAYREAVKEERGSEEPGKKIVNDLKKDLESRQRIVASYEEIQATASEIRCSFTGRVIERVKQEGAYLRPGDSVLRIERVGKEIKELEAVLYVSPIEGKKVMPGMKVDIIPTTVNVEEFGFMLGKVIRVSQFPATDERMMAVLGNRKLVEDLCPGGSSPFEVYADLISDLNTPTGYKWSSRRGPPGKVYSGALCKARITVRKRSPISLFIPYFNPKADLPGS